MSKRLFFSVDIEPGVGDRIVEVINKIKGIDVDVNFVRKENIHITVKFLGNVDEGEIEKVKHIAGHLSDNFSPFQTGVNGLGYFGNPNFIKVLWVGISKGGEKLKQIMEEFNKEFDYIKSDNYKPNPHITLGRVKSGRNREELLHFLERNKNLNIGEFEVKEIKLKESLLSKGGPEYTDLEVFPLG